jgi:hypothetical protein
MTFDAVPGVPALGHVTRGHWHPGRADGCPKCDDGILEVMEPTVISEQFFDGDGNPVNRDDPTAVRAEIDWTDDDGEIRRTYADL